VRTILSQLALQQHEKFRGPEMSGYYFYTYHAWNIGEYNWIFVLKNKEKSDER